MEPDTSGGLGDAAFVGTWECPSCKNETATFSCMRCGVRRNVVSAATGIAAPLFTKIEHLFFESLKYCKLVSEQQHHNLSTSSFEEKQDEKDSRNAKDTELSIMKEQIYHQIESLLKSTEMESLIQANWLIRDAISHLLKTAMTGNTTFAFQSSWMDNNSMALYILLIDQLTNKMSDADKDRIQIERPVIVATTQETRWKCALCSKENMIVDKICVCGVDFKVFGLCQQKDVSELFHEVETFVTRIIHTITTTPTTKNYTDKIKTDILLNIHMEIDKFYKVSKLKKLESRGWKLQGMIATLFDKLLAENLEIPFLIDSDADMNSIGLYAILINQIIAKLESLYVKNPLYNKITIMPPHADCLPEEYSYEDFEVQVHPVHANANYFLQHNKKLLLAICKQIANGCESKEWVSKSLCCGMNVYLNILFIMFPPNFFVSLQDTVASLLLPQFNQTGWLISDAITLMRKGMRDLNALTSQGDPGSRAVIEALLRKILKLESVSNSNVSGMEKMSLNDGNVEMRPCVRPQLTRQLSLSSDCRNALSLLRQQVDQDKFKTIILYLTKLVKNIRSDPANMSHRRLHKENEVVMELILPNPEVISLLNFIGFVNDDDMLFMPTVNRDAVARAFSVLTELSKDI